MLISAKERVRPEVVISPRAIASSAVLLGAAAFTVADASVASLAYVVSFISGWATAWSP